MYSLPSGPREFLKSARLMEILDSDSRPNSGSSSTPKIFPSTNATENPSLLDHVNQILKTLDLTSNCFSWSGPSFVLYQACCAIASWWGIDLEADESEIGSLYDSGCIICPFLVSVILSWKSSITIKWGVVCVTQIPGPGICSLGMVLQSNKYFSVSNW